MRAGPGPGQVRPEHRGGVVTSTPKKKRVQRSGAVNRRNTTGPHEVQPNHRLLRSCA